MKTKQTTQAAAAFALLLAYSLAPLGFVHASTTITDTNYLAYGANLGWINARGDVANGAIIGEYVCSGYLWAANVGWIGLGSGTPANGIQYQNNSASDWGVNHDGLGNLRGYAYGANIGWIAFETTGAPKVDLATGKLSGHAWSANCGWISLSNAVAHVQTAYLAPGADSDGDGIADAWERMKFGNLTTANATSDFDGDGQGDLQEYLADTNPRDGNDRLRITFFSRGTPTPTYNVLVWTARPTRLYRVEQRTAFAAASPWETRISMDWAGRDNVGFDDFATNAFYRIRAVKPLAP